MTDVDQKFFIQPRKLANKNGELRYTWQIKEFARLDGLLYSDKGEIQVILRGRIDDRQRSLIDAQINASIQLECQTSFEPVDYQIDTKITYCALVKEEQIADLDDDLEALLVEDGEVDIRQVIEDELILSLPIVTNKASEDLGIKMSYGQLDEARPIKKNPFLVLSDLKLDSSSKE